jgi:hypothetical protein
MPQRASRRYVVWQRPFVCRSTPGIINRSTAWRTRPRVWAASPRPTTLRKPLSSRQLSRVAGARQRLDTRLTPRRFFENRSSTVTGGVVVVANRCCVPTVEVADRKSTTPTTYLLPHGTAEETGRQDDGVSTLGVCMLVDQGQTCGSTTSTLATWMQLSRELARDGAAAAVV